MLPLPLVAEILLEAEAPLSPEALEASFRARLEDLEQSGAVLALPEAGRRPGWPEALATLRLRRLIVEEAGMIRANPAETALLAYYARSIPRAALPPVSGQIRPPARPAKDAVAEPAAAIFSAQSGTSESGET